MKTNVLVVPVAAQDKHNTEFKQGRDYINCVEALRGIHLFEFDKIVYIINRSLNNDEFLEERIQLDLKRLVNRRVWDSPPVYIVQISDTNSMAESVYQGLFGLFKNSELKNMTVFIKDGDNCFGSDTRWFTSNINKGTVDYNAVVSASLERQELVDTIHKSYFKEDNHGFITNIIERRVLSDKFVAGGYFFTSAWEYIKVFEILKQIQPSFYISDIIYYMILNNDEKFRPVETQYFEDFNLNQYRHEEKHIDR